MQSTRGVIFCPDNPECIALLMSKVLSPDLVIPNIHHNYKPYDQTQLPDIFAAAQENDFYFFTKLRRKGKSSSKNADRTVGNKTGTWHGEQNRNVTYCDLGLVGTLHTFTYTEPGSVYDGCFLMTEYHLLEDTCLDYNPLKNHVLCVLRANNSSASKKKHKSSDLTSNQEAAAAPMKKKVRTSTAPPICNQQPLAVEEAAFQNSETPQDSAVIQSLPQVYNCDDGRFNNDGDPLLYAPPPPTAAAATSNVWDQISPYNQYSCQVEASQFQTPLLVAGSIYFSTIDCSTPFYCKPEAIYNVLPLVMEDPNSHPFGEPLLAH